MSENLQNFKNGDRVIVRRGDHRNEAGTVLAVDSNTGQHAVHLDNGAVATVKRTNLREPAQPTIGVLDLASVLQEMINQGARGMVETFLDTATDQGEEWVEAVRAELAWPVEVQE